jgi:hypothetical protein
MVYTKEDFNARIGAVDKDKSNVLRRGYTTKIDKNGIIVVKPRAKRLRLPIKGVVFLIAGFLCLKALMLSANGPDTYNDRLATLENGNVIETVGARVLGIDPVTQLIANKIGTFFR